MPRKYSFESDTDEQQPLDTYGSPQRTTDYRQRRLSLRDQQSSQRRQEEPYYDEPYETYQYEEPSRPMAAHGPGAHPSSSYGRIAESRQRSQLPTGAVTAAAPPPLMTTFQQFQHTADDNDHDQVSPVSPPRPPPHRRSALQSQQPQQDPQWTRDQRYSYPPSSATDRLPPSVVTPGADNFGESAAGGVAGIAYSVAEQNARESGLQAMRSISQRRGQEQHQRPYGAAAGQHSPDRNSGSSLQGLGAAALAPGSATPRSRATSRSPHSIATDGYADDPYQGYSGQDPSLGVLDPSEIEDDGDDGLEYGRHGSGTRMSMMSRVGHSRRHGSHSRGISGAAAIGAVGAVAAGGAAVAAAVGNRVSSGVHYSSVQNGLRGGRGGSGGSGVGSSGAGVGGAGAGAGASASSAGGGVMGGIDDGSSAEKSEWLARQSTSSKRWRWAVIIGLGLATVVGIVCGVVFGVVLKHNNKSGSSSSSSSGDGSTDSDSGTLTLKSAEIQKLLNNANLHKVFPGIDYTPINTQYPDCLTNPPSQNNVTRDVAVLSQLTNTIRLYGTDCNQTEMTIAAIEALEMQDAVKIWMGVWQDGNATTNARQLAQMWEVLDASGSEPFVGIIVANEILYREQMTTSELSSLLSEVRSNLSAHGAEGLPVATSDLGTVWDATLAEASDYVMANIHPFFGGVNATDAAAWTWDFWETDVGSAFKTNTSRNIISETGWPSQGGNDCGTGSTETSCPEAAVAGISELNRFMEDWVCQALANGTQYFWFEAFDEPWKISFDTDDENWEDHWGLMDVNRNLKKGVTIPDCGGLTV